MKQRMLRLAAALAVAFTLLHPAGALSTARSVMIRPVADMNCDGTGVCPS